MNWEPESSNPNSLNINLFWVKESWAICQPSVQHASLILGLFSVLSPWFYVCNHTCRAHQLQWPGRRAKSQSVSDHNWSPGTGDSGRGWTRHIFLICGKIYALLPSGCILRSLGVTAWTDFILCCPKFSGCLQILLWCPYKSKEGLNNLMFPAIKTLGVTFFLCTIIPNQQMLSRRVLFFPNKVLPPTLVKKGRWQKGENRFLLLEWRALSEDTFAVIVWFQDDISLEVVRGMSVYRFCRISCSTEPCTLRKWAWPGEFVFLGPDLIGSS